MGYLVLLGSLVLFSSLVALYFFRRQLSSIVPPPFRTFIPTQIVPLAHCAGFQNFPQFISLFTFISSRYMRISFGFQAVLYYQQVESFMR